MKKKVLIVGLGTTGLSLVRHAHAKGFCVQAVDTRAEPPMLKTVRSEFDDVRFRQIKEYAEVGQLAADCRYVWLSSGVSPYPLCLPSGMFPHGDLELFTRGFNEHWRPKAKGKPKLVLITGTNGKSTCASLTAGFLKSMGLSVATVGNIGVPLLGELELWNRYGWPEVVIAEVSSFQLALRKTAYADVACLLNVTADHLTWHGSRQNYLAAKTDVYRNAAVGVFNRRDRSSMRGSAQASRRIGFGGSRASSGEWAMRNGMLSRRRRASNDALSRASLLRAGIMPDTAAAALTVAAQACGKCSDAQMLDWLAQQEGLAHRFRLVGNVSGVAYIDDSKATNQAAACAAIDAVGVDKAVLIAGGESKEYSFARLARAARKLVGVVLIGEAAPLLRRALDDSTASICSATSMEQAVVEASAIAKQKGANCVLLSPACASFDMFADFNARGDAFIAAVQRLLAHDHAHAS